MSPEPSLLDLNLFARLTLETGINCCGMDAMHKAAEALLGGPIWTHEFALRETWLELKIALAALDEGYVYKHNRETGPIETLQRMAGNKPIIAITSKGVQRVR